MGHKYVDIHVSFNTGNLSAFRPLPHFHLPGVGHPVLIQRQPEGIVLQLAEIVQVFRLMPVKIDHGRKTHLFHLSAEMELNIRQGAGVHVLRPGITGWNFPVQNDGHVQFHPCFRQNIQQELDFLVGFLDIQRLGKEICTDFQPSFKTE